MTVKKSGYDSDLSPVQCLHFYADTAGDILYLSSKTLARSTRHVQYFSVQSSQSGNLYLTLSPDTLATDPNPAVQSMVLWDTAIALTANTITMPGKTFTALKFTFTAPGELHIALE